MNGLTSHPGRPFDRKISLTRSNSDVKDYGASLGAVYDFGGAELTSISAYRYNNLNAAGTPTSQPRHPLPGRQRRNGKPLRTFTQELRLQGELWNGRLEWRSAAITPMDLRTLDNLGYGADYSRYANCLVAQNLPCQRAVCTGPAEQSERHLL